MKYLIVGAGGTGGALGAYLAAGGLDVTLIARGEHLAALRARGLRLLRPSGEETVTPVAASDMEHYAGTPDVAFVCVKGYSLEGTAPFLRRIAGAECVVIPLLNGFGIGNWLQERLPGTPVMDGCIYIAAELHAPGCVLMRGSVLRAVFGPRGQMEAPPVLERVAEDLNGCGVSASLSYDIRRDTLMKLAYVSPQGACGAYYDVPAGAMQRPGPYRDCFAMLAGEVASLGAAMGIRFAGDPVAESLRFLDSLPPEMTTSLQRDLKAGGPSELDGLVCEVVRLGERYGVALPKYRSIAGELARRAGISL